MGASFSQIPNDLLVPGFFIEIQGTPLDNAETDIEPVLILAPKTSEGTATANEPVRCVSTQEGRGLLGQGSFGARMVELFRANNPFKELWIIPIADDGAAVKALWTFTVIAVDVLAGSIFFYVGGQLLQIPVTTDTDVATVAQAIMDKIDDTPSLPLETVAGPTAVSDTFTANVDNTLTTTSAHTGAVGDRVRFTTTTTLPSPLLAGTDYFLISSTTPALTVSTSKGGSVVDITDTGTGTHTITFMDKKTFTARAKNGGTLGNDIDLRLNHKGSAAGQKTPDGITFSWSATTPGSTDPSIVAAITAMSDDKYDYILNPWAVSTPLDLLQTQMETRWRWDKMIYGHVFSVMRKSSADALTFGGTRNNKHESVADIYDWPSPTWEILAAAVGQLAALLDADPAMPEQGLQLVGILPAKVGSTGRFTDEVRQSFLQNGVATFTMNRQSAFLERMITTYQTDELDATDRTYLDVQTLFTLMRVARFIRRFLLAKFTRKKLADDGDRRLVTSNVVTPSMIKNECIAAYAILVDVGWVEDLASFKDQVDVARPDDNPNRVNILFPDDLVNQLRTSALLLRFKN